MTPPLLAHDGLREFGIEGRIQGMMDLQVVDDHSRSGVSRDAFAVVCTHRREHRSDGTISACQ